LTPSDRKARILTIKVPIAQRSHKGGLEMSDDAPSFTKPAAGTGESGRAGKESGRAGKRRWEAPKLTVESADFEVAKIPVTAEQNWTVQRRS
jgi:hypothetical protein